MTPQSAPCLLTRLPGELLAIVTSHLANLDIKHLRAANRAINRIVSLRLSRVFLSANTLNIQVFRAVADHDDLRKGVTEIVWDDARLIDDEYSNRSQGLCRSGKIPEDCPQWFSTGRRASLEWRFGVVDGGWNGNTIPDDVMSLDQCWLYYKSLLRDQNSVLDSGSDIESFKYGLARFPSLRRITITPAAYGVTIGSPLYETPMLRAFPPTFAYPLPRGWPNTRYPYRPPDVFPWHSSSYDSRCGYGTIDQYRDIWRGFRLLLRALAESQHQVSEFSVAVHHLITGINCHIFDQPCQEYDDFVALLSRPGFHCLDLAIATGDLELDDWSSLRGGLLRDALSAAVDLEYLSISSTMGIEACGFPMVATGEEDIVEELCLPLRSIFPVDKWPRLRHFGIARFLVQQSELMELLASLPESLRSVELSCLSFLEPEGCYMSLLREMRNMLSWRDRPSPRRPRVTIKLDREMGHPRGAFVSVDKAADKFLYAATTDQMSNPNPFGEEAGSNYPEKGLGAVDRSHLDPSIERAYDPNGW